MWGRFNPRFKGRDVFGEPVPKSGLAYTAPLEWMLAGVWSTDLYKFMELPASDPESPLDQARIIAAYRCENRMQAVVAHDQTKEMQRKARKGRRGGKGSSRPA